MLKKTCTWVQSGSSHKAASRLCSNAATAQLDNHTSGTTTVQNRSRGRQCPYCSNRRVCLHNSLATIAPDAAQYWNHNKNEKAPEQVLAGSTSRAEWKCPACYKEWQASVYQHTHTRTGCPKCSSTKRNKKQPQPTFAEAQPAELAEWDHERNDAEGIFAENITLGSGKMVYWICSCCPRGQPHRWTAAPYTCMSHGHGCAVCAGKQACVCNSLASLSPDLAVGFHVDKNGFAPSEITAQSHTEVWWRTANRGSWRQSPHYRKTRRNRLSLSRCSYASSPDCSAVLLTMPREFARPSVTTAWSTETKTCLAACCVPCVAAMAVDICNHPENFAHSQIRAILTVRQHEQQLACQWPHGDGSAKHAVASGTSQTDSCATV